MLDPAWKISHTPGIVTLTDANTTLGYCRYDDRGEVEYLFVNAAFRRRGIARELLRLVEATVGCKPRFLPPLSPLGRALEQAYLAEAHSYCKTTGRE